MAYNPIADTAVSV